MVLFVDSTRRNHVGVNRLLCSWKKLAKVMQKADAPATTICSGEVELSSMSRDTAGVYVMLSASIRTVGANIDSDRSNKDGCKMSSDERTSRRIYVHSYSISLPCVLETNDLHEYLSRAATYMLGREEPIGDSYRLMKP